MLESTLRQMKSASADKRAYAAEKLGRSKNALAVSALLVALKDRDSSVRCAAAKSLGQIGAPQTFGPLLTALKNSDERWVEKAVAVALTRFRDPYTTESLVSLLDLKQGRSGLREITAWILEERKKPVLRGRPYYVYHTLSVIHFVLCLSLGSGAVFGLAEFYPWYLSQLPDFYAGRERDGILSEVRSGNMIYRTKSAGGAVVGEWARGLMELLFLVLPVCVSALTLLWIAIKTGWLLSSYFTTRYSGFTLDPFLGFCTEFKRVRDLFSEQS